MLFDSAGAGNAEDASCRMRDCFFDGLATGCHRLYHGLVVGNSASFHNGCFIFLSWLLGCSAGQGIPMTWSRSPECNQWRARAARGTRRIARCPEAIPISPIRLTWKYQEQEEQNNKQPPCYSVEQNRAKTRKYLSRCGWWEYTWRLSVFSRQECTFYFFSAAGCRNGADCCFCHEFHPRTGKYSIYMTPEWSASCEKNRLPRSWTFHVALL